MARFPAITILALALMCIFILSAAHPEQPGQVVDVQGVDGDNNRIGGTNTPVEDNRQQQNGNKPSRNHKRATDADFNGNHGN